jgi:2-C-methyl-D-erythritol 4-phosphate cytidylyltransferase
LSVVGIVPAGGSGERLGASGPKAFVVCAGRPMVEWSLAALAGACARVVVAVPAGHERPPDRVRGGRWRSESVRNALAAAPEATVVVVHDAARPLVTPGLVARCIDALEGADAAIAAARVTDTVKEAGHSGLVERTLERDRLWAVQTPQVFRAGVLRAALDASTEVLAAATDDASLVERAGGTVRLVESSPNNLKVTTDLDLRMAEAILRSRC